MKAIAKLIVIILANALALWGAAHYIQGFVLTGDFKELATAALILTGLNLLVKPVIKMILGPIIVLTLGLGLILVNAIVLYILDILSKNLTIENIPALFYASVLVGVINFVFHLATK